MSPILPFENGSPLFRQLQSLWKEELGEELSYEQAVVYGEKCLTLVAAVARWKRSAA